VFFVAILPKTSHHFAVQELTTSEEYGNARIRTRRQSWELDFHNWDNFDGKLRNTYVVLHTAGGEQRAFSSRNKKFVEKVIAAVNEAIIHRG